MRTKTQIKDNAIIYFKKANSHNYVVIPNKFIEKWGNEFYMEMYSDKIVLKPIKKLK